MDFAVLADYTVKIKEREKKDWTINKNVYFLQKCVEMISRQKLYLFDSNIYIYGFI